MKALRWTGGTPELRAEIEQAMETPDPAQNPEVELLAGSKHRRSLRVPSASLGQSVVVKEFLPPSRHSRKSRRWIEILRILCGRSSAALEWTNYEDLTNAGVPIPEPLAFARLRDGTAWIVTRFLPDAVPLEERLQGYPFEKRRRMREVGELVHHLHSAGYSHRDLHVGNVLVSEKEMWFVDLQRAQPMRHTSDRILDIASLDFSLHHAGVTVAARLRFRIAALGLGTFRVAAERELLREVGRTSHRRAVEFYHDRTRRLLRDGEGVAKLRIEEGRGMRLADIRDGEVAAMLEAHREVVAAGGEARLKCDHRSNVTRVEVAGRRAIVKEVVKTSTRKRLADVFRGSPAQRAWLAGHGLRLRGIGAATPYAFVERREHGVPVESWVVLEDLGNAPCAADLSPEQAREVGFPRRLLSLLRTLHRAEVVHGDLQALHIHLVDGEPTLIDLESVRFLECLYDRHRIKMLAELNGSIADEVLPADARCDLFDRYVLALPFDRGNARALREIVRASLARRQRWRGEGCEISRLLDES